MDVKLKVLIWYKKQYEDALESIQLGFPSHIRAFMYKNNMKSYELAKKLDVAPEYLSSMMSGKKKFPINLVEKFIILEGM